MIPSPWVALVLALGTFRAVRLVGWDEWPYAVRLRQWLSGRNERNQGVRVYEDDPRGTYTRPTVAKFLGCPWCVGAWLSLAVYILWLWFPAQTVYGAAPFALSAAVGLIAKNLDP